MQGKPFNINILQTHAPTEHHDYEDIDQFYEEIQAINQAKSDEIICIWVTWMPKLDQYNMQQWRYFGLGDKNDRGERLIQFCK